LDDAVQRRRKQWLSETSQNGGKSQAESSNAQKGQPLAQNSGNILGENASTILLVAAGVAVVGAGVWAVSRAYNWMTGEEAPSEGKQEDEELERRLEELKIKAKRNAGMTED
jgi:hypothetical protein